MNHTNQSLEFDNIITKVKLNTSSLLPIHALHGEHVQQHLISYCYTWVYPSEEQFKLLIDLFKVENDSVRISILQNAQKNMKLLQLQIIQEQKKHTERMNTLLKCISHEALKESTAEYQNQKLKEIERNKINVNFKKVGNAYLCEKIN